MVPAAAQRPCELIRAISQTPGRFGDVFFGVRGNVTGERRLIQDDRNGGGRKSAFASHVAQSDGDVLRSFRIHLSSCNVNIPFPAALQTFCSSVRGSDGYELSAAPPKRALDRASDLHCTKPI